MLSLGTLFCERKNVKILIRITSVFLCLSFLTLAFASCKTDKSKEKFTKTIYGYFDTITTVTVYAESQSEFLEIAELIEARLSEYHMLYDAYHSKTDDGYEKKYEGITNIKDINATVGGAHIKRHVDRKIIDLLLYCKEIYALTGGETNVAMGSVLKLWHDERDKAEKNPTLAALPDAEALSAAALHTDINKIIIDEEESTVFLSDPEMLLDVGAVAKGYATEMIARELREMGVEHCALSVGGNVRTVGCKPNDEKWSVGIENPLDPFEPYVEKVSIAEKSVVTSGSYQRYYTVDGKQYHHIIDRDTLYPSVYFKSVSVITENSALADALSTALFSMPLEDGRALLDGIAGIEAVWVLADGAKAYSSGFSDYVTK